MVIALVVTPAPAIGLELLQFDVDVRDGRYHVYGQSRIEAGSELVYSVLMDYDNFHKLASGIAETYYLPPDDAGRLEAYTRFETCILFFCRSVEKVERIVATPGARIDVEAIPEHSDFVIFESSWIIEQETGTTKLTFQAQFEADFWVPPLIGPWAVKRKLANTAELIGTRVEFLSANNLTLDDVSD